ncbi:MAG: 3-dehydroquinate synthase [Bdellovibrionia bacterium]
MKKFTMNLADRSHEVWFGENILGKLSNFSFLKKASKVFIFSDLCLESQARKLKAELKAAGIEAKLISLQVSEELKDFHTLYPLYGELLKGGADRHSVILALGGGVIGDALGFIAGTYMRGIRWIGIPSTLLAQVDSCLGGKTGINHERGKNLIGMIHQPSLVVCELSLIRSLQKRDLISGLGEMIKYGLVFDPDFFTRLKKNWRKILQISSKSSEVRSSKLLEHEIQECLQWKAKVVDQDERDEKGIREVLNFGHTFGHALEAESGYGYFRHGEAVIYGMRVACAVSVKRGYLDHRVQTDIDTFLAAIPVPPLPKGVPIAKYIKRIQTDKKARNKKARFVLLKKIGGTVLDRDVSDREIMDSILEVRGRTQ